MAIIDSISEQWSGQYDKRLWQPSLLDNYAVKVNIGIVMGLFNAEV